MSAPAPHTNNNDDTHRFWHAPLEVSVHGYDAVRSITDHDMRKRWRVVVDDQNGVLAYVRPEAAEMVVSALRRMHEV